MVEVLKEAVARAEAGEAVVLVTLVEHEEGGGPRPAGARMLVGAGGRICGSVGGGDRERAMVERARDLLAADHPRLVWWRPPDNGVSRCGGPARFLLEPLAPASRLLIIGAGHVGTALARLAVSCSWAVTLLDDRPPLEEAECAFRRIKDYGQPLTDLVRDRRCALVICTRSHATDLQALRAALATPAGFIGLLGSRRKRESFFTVLRQEGIEAQQLARVTTPVGLDIGARTPAEIAVAIMAQLIRGQGTGDRGVR